VKDRYDADLILYPASAAFALFTAFASTLEPHRVWGAVAVWGYAGAALAVLTLRQWPSVAVRGRAVVTAVAWVATALVPLVILAAQRATGRGGRAQEEVIVVERGAQRLFDTGTPYLGRAAIAALPPDERLLGYLPYQPGMVLFGLPRALFGVSWATDARVWFALVTVVVLAAALWTVRGAGSAAVLAAQSATVLPLCALALAVGGDDLPVLALCLLALAAGGGWRSGLAVGAAGALKLFAWPVAVVLLAYALTRGRRDALAYALPAFGLPVLALVPAFLVDTSAAIENVVRLPLGRGLVSSPARSPFPGQLIASHLPGGRLIAAALLGLAALALAWWLWRRPPREPAAAATVCAVGLTVAILLIPATRFGYLLYPAAYLLWVPALRSRSGVVGRTQGG
jgi:hypothetical protein